MGSAKSLAITMPKIQAQILGNLLNCPSSPKSVGLFLMPTFSFEKGKLHKLEESCQKLLGQNNINLDGVAVLPYKGRCDDRSKRLGCEYHLLKFSAAKSYFLGAAEMQSFIIYIYISSVCEFAANVLSWCCNVPPIMSSFSG